jgi:aspartate/glutamate racemase
MEGPAYPTAFRRHGLELLAPSAVDRAEINRVIFAELCHGIITETPATTTFA